MGRWVFIQKQKGHVGGVMNQSPTRAQGATNPGFRGSGGGDHEHEVCQDDLLQEFEEFEADLPFYCESRLL